VANARLLEVQANLARAEKAEAEAKAHLKQSEANFALARKVVDECFGIAKDHPLLQGPLLSDELHRLKRLLLEKALPFYQQFRAARPGDRGIERDLLVQHSHIAYIQNELGSKAEALVNYQQAEQAIRELLKAHPGVPEYQVGLAITLADQALVQQDLGQRKEALKSYSEAIGLYRPLVKAHPGVPAYQSGLTTTLTNRGILH